MSGQAARNLEEAAQLGLEMEKNGVRGNNCCIIICLMGIIIQEMDEHLKAMWAGQSNVLVAVRYRVCTQNYVSH